MKKLILFLFCFFMLIGCSQGHLSMTEQMMRQTDNPEIVSLATYGDALQVYVEAQELYIPYMQIIREEDPNLDTKIIDNFKVARKILDRWRILGTVSEGDELAYRNAIRELSIDIARYIEKGE